MQRFRAPDGNLAAANCIERRPSGEAERAIDPGIALAFPPKQRSSAALGAAYGFTTGLRLALLLDGVARVAG